MTDADIHRDEEVDEVDEVDTGRALAWLRECNGPFEGRIHPLVAGVHVVGRTREATVVLTDHDVSRRHARLQVSPEGLWLEDLESKNGVFLDGTTRVEGPVLLEHGHRFQVGGVTLELSHPDSRVLRALEQAGEFTMTRYTVSRVRELGSRRARGGARGLLVPLAATLMFALLSVLLWLRP